MSERRTIKGSKADTANKTTATAQQPTTENANAFLGSGNTRLAKKLSSVCMGGLWMHTPENGGDPYLAGSFGFARIAIFRNKNKTEDGQPDFYLVIGERLKREKATKADAEHVGK